MDINLIGVPMNYGCDREGAQYGPSKLRESHIIDIIQASKHKVDDLGDISIPKVPIEEKYSGHKNMKYLDPIIEINESLAREVYDSLKSNRFPFIIGGDHSLGMGSIAGSSQHFKDIAVIWIDAHGDINTHETSPSGNVHGMPLAASMAVGHPSLTNLYFDGQKVKPENVYILGARDIDPGEIKLSEELNLNLYTMDIVREKGLINILKEIIVKIKDSNVNGVHLSFDIDVLDKSIVPGTGTAVDNGFDLEEGKFIFTTLLKENFVTSMDFVELNPLLDDSNEKTIKTCTDMLKHIFETINLN